MTGDGHNGFEYPYKAVSPVDGQSKEFFSIDDVYGELLNCYQELQQKRIRNVSETLYTEHFFFCNTSELLDSKTQQRIKEYNFCKAFNCPPYPTIKETPINLIDDFLNIELITLQHSKNKIKEKNGNKK